MYAVIRSGGKQYRVAPGDVIKVEKTPHSEGAIDLPTFWPSAATTFPPTPRAPASPVR